MLRILRAVNGPWGKKSEPCGGSRFTDFNNPNLDLRYHSSKDHNLTDNPIFGTEKQDPSFYLVELLKKCTGQQDIQHKGE